MVEHDAADTGEPPGQGELPAVISAVTPSSRPTRYRCGPSSSSTWSNPSARAVRSTSGSASGEGMTWNTPRSAIHGEGRWLVANAWIAGRLSLGRLCSW